jgi:hypothetical protein
MDEIRLQPFGYSEMYEWEVVPDQKFARFVTFSKNDPSKIVPFGASADDFILGISTINSFCDSDNSPEWHKKYKTNEVGDLLIEKERLAVGTKIYDENMEMSLIKTYPWEHLVLIPSEEYDETQTYKPRANREEWVRVNLCGKAIVYDNGECKPGEYCTPYVGRLKGKRGTVIPASEDSKNKFYILERVSENSILIVNK